MEAELAAKLACWLTMFQIMKPNVVEDGWEFYALDIGEIEVTTNEGVCFRLIVEHVENGFD